jgi:pyruvate/2-oxoglutarate dehydrogenase complex dihydrolipoamide acyltransferase (E2) component
LIDSLRTMPIAIHVPRINNNDDEVKLVELSVAIGDAVKRGQIIGQVETDKSVVDVEAPDDGFVIAINADPDRMISVGSILLWLGSSADEVPPAPAGGQGVAETRSDYRAVPTAKAKSRLTELGLNAADISCRGDRITVEDVERYAAARNQPVRPPAAIKTAVEYAATDLPGQLCDLRGDERGMLATVRWHRDVAAAGYIELEYDPRPWVEFAKSYAERRRLLLSPLLSLLAWRLVGLCADTPALNATLQGDKRLEYTPVNLGFTIQADATLYLAVVRDAASLGMDGFVDGLADVQRRAALHTLEAHETSGATIGFSSMARWKVSRHIPILAPNTALMVAHAYGSETRGVIGASYDHRVLNGAQVVAALRSLSRPPTTK